METPGARLREVLYRGALAGSKGCVDMSRIHEDSLRELEKAIEDAKKKQNDGKEEEDELLVSSAVFLLQCRRCIHEKRGLDDIIFAKGEKKIFPVTWQLSEEELSVLRGRTTIALHTPEEEYARETRDEIRLMRQIAAENKAVRILKAAFLVDPVERTSHLEAAIVASAHLVPLDQSPELQLLSFVAFGLAACSAPPGFAIEEDTVAEIQEARNRLILYQRVHNTNVHNQDETWLSAALDGLNAYLDTYEANRAGAELYAALMQEDESALAAAVKLYDFQVRQQDHRGIRLTTLADRALDLMHFAVSRGEEEQNIFSAPVLAARRACNEAQRDNDPVVSTAARSLADGIVSRAERALHLQRMRTQHSDIVLAHQITGTPGSLRPPLETEGQALRDAAAEAAAWAPVLSTDEARFLARSAIFGYGLRSAALCRNWSKVASLLELGGDAVKRYVSPFYTAEDQETFHSVQGRALAILTSSCRQQEADEIIADDTNVHHVTTGPWYRSRAPGKDFCTGYIEAENALQSRDLISLHRGLGLPEAMENELRLLAACANDAAVSAMLTAALGWFKESSLVNNNESIVREANAAGARALERAIAVADRPLFGAWPRPKGTSMLISTARAFLTLRSFRAVGVWFSSLPAVFNHVSDNDTENNEEATTSIETALPTARRLVPLLCETCDSITFIDMAKELDDLDDELRSRKLVETMRSALEQDSNVLALDEALALVERTYLKEGDIGLIQSMSDLCLCARRLSWLVAPDADANYDDFTTTVSGLLTELQLCLNKFLLQKLKYAYGVSTYTHAPLHATVSFAVEALSHRAHIALDSSSAVTTLQKAIDLEPSQPGTIRRALLDLDTRATNLSPDVLDFLDQARRFVAIQRETYPGNESPPADEEKALESHYDAPHQDPPLTPTSAVLVATEGGS